MLGPKKDKYKVCSLLNKTQPNFGSAAAFSCQFCQDLRYQNRSKGLVCHYINIDTMGTFYTFGTLMWYENNIKAGCRCRLILQAFYLPYAYIHKFLNCSIWLATVLYIRTVSCTCSTELVEIGLWAICAGQHAPYTLKAR